MCFFRYGGNDEFQKKRPIKEKSQKAFDKAGLSLLFSLLALLVSILSYYGPQLNAAGRIQTQIDAAKYFKVAMFASCERDQKSNCKTALELAIAGTEEAMKALEAERTNLSASDFNAAYQAINGTYLEARVRKFELENPGLLFPDIQLSQKDLEKIRAIEKNIE